MGALRRKQTNADRKYVGRTEPPRDMDIVAAEGSRVRDARGRTFIDFQMGWCVGNLGWNPPEAQDTLMMLPPLTVDEQTVEQALEILERAS
jgi:4-aminobutyrate aminotransferase-like enzyme